MTPEFDQSKCAFCPDHLNTVRELVEIHTIQKIVVDNQNDLKKSIEEIKITLTAMKLSAQSNQNNLTSQIKEEKIKITPFYWACGIAGMALISAIVDWIIKLFGK